MSLDTPTYLRDAYPNFQIGDGTYGGLRVFDWKQGTTLAVGNYSSFAFDVKVLLGGEHRANWVSTYPFSALWPEAEHIEGHPVTRGSVKIGSDVWVGAEAMILSGVTIGDGAVIGARSLVNKDVAPYEIVGGTPAKSIGFRFPSATVDELLKIRWWNWPRHRIVRALPDLLSSDMTEFLDGCKKGKYGT